MLIKYQEILALLLAVTAVFISGCASVVDGTLEATQRMVITSAPSGADVFAGVNRICSTPCSQRMEKWRIPSLSISKDGFLPVQIESVTEVDATTFGNILAGGVVGVAFDVASGRAVQFKDQVHVILVPRESSPSS